MRALLKNESFVILPIFDWRAMGTHSYSDISQCRKECEMMHNNDFEILRKRLVDCEEKLQKAKTDNAAIKINEKDIERQEKISGDLMKLILELTNRVSALEAEGKKKDERFERLED
jgi:hypothetical protein